MAGWLLLWHAYVTLLPFFFPPGLVDTYGETQQQGWMRNCLRLLLGLRFEV